MSRCFETKRRALVVTLWDLVEVATSVTDEAAEVVAFVEHILRTRASAAPGVAGESGLAHHGGAPRERLMDPLFEEMAAEQPFPSALCPATDRNENDRRYTLRAELPALKRKTERSS